MTSPIYIPLMPKTKRPIKAAAGWSDLRVDDATVGRWWDAAPEDANTALRLDGLLVIDCDSEEARDWWLSQPDVETDYVVKTPHGWHFYYLLPEGIEPPPAGAMKHPDGRPRGIDVKTGPGHYVLVPPSKNEDGEVYRWM